MLCPENDSRANRDYILKRNKNPLTPCARYEHKTKKWTFEPKLTVAETAFIFMLEKDKNWNKEKIKNNHRAKKIMKNLLLRYQKESSDTYGDNKSINFQNRTTLLALLKDLKKEQN